MTPGWPHNSAKQNPTVGSPRLSLTSEISLTPLSQEVRSARIRRGSKKYFMQSTSGYAAKKMQDHKVAADGQETTK